MDSPESTPFAKRGIDILKPGRETPVQGSDKTLAEGDTAQIEDTSFELIRAGRKNCILKITRPQNRKRSIQVSHKEVYAIGGTELRFTTKADVAGKNKLGVNIKFNSTSPIEAIKQP